MMVVYWGELMTKIYQCCVQGKYGKNNAQKKKLTEKIYDWTKSEVKNRKKNPIEIMGVCGYELCVVCVNDAPICH